MSRRQRSVRVWRRAAAAVALSVGLAACATAGAASTLPTGAQAHVILTAEHAAFTAARSDHGACRPGHSRHDRTFDVCVARGELVAAGLDARQARVAGAQARRLIAGVCQTALQTFAAAAAGAAADLTVVARTHALGRDPVAFARDMSRAGPLLGASAQSLSASRAAAGRHCGF